MMISGPSIPAPALQSTESVLQKIRFVTTLYALLLLIVGVVTVRFDGWFLTVLDAVCVPVILYVLAVYRYGSGFFGAGDPALRARTWSRWLWTGAILFAVVYPILLGLALLFGNANESATPKEILQIVVDTLLATLSPILFAWIGDRAFLHPPAFLRRSPSRLRVALAFSLSAGSALVLSSLLLDVSYDQSPGWKLLLWRGRWVSDEFSVGSAAVGVPLDVLQFVFYVASLLFALACFFVALRIFAGKSLTPRAKTLLLHSSMVVLWFTLTNYFGNCLYYAVIGIFSFGTSPREKAGYYAVTALWLLMFVAGVYLWFRFSRHTCPRAHAVLTALILWAVPLMFATVCTAWIPIDYDIYGFVAFVAGVQILAACAWKIAPPPLPAA